MEVRAQFLGNDESGFKQYRYYTLDLSDNTVVYPHTEVNNEVNKPRFIIEYASVEDFLSSWHVARTSR